MSEYISTTIFTLLQDMPRKEALKAIEGTIKSLELAKQELKKPVIKKVHKVGRRISSP